MRFVWLLILAAASLVAQTPVSVGTFAAEVRTSFTVRDGLASNDVLAVALVAPGRVAIETSSGTQEGGAAGWQRVTRSVPADSRKAVSRDGRVAEARADGLFIRAAGGDWVRQLPREGKRSWAPVDVRAVAFDNDDRLWFAAPQGVGVLDGSAWRLYAGSDGLPYDDFTAIGTGERGVVWFGTRRGAIRFDGKTWEYRQGPRWLPGDEVRGFAIEPNGNAWIATNGGLALIERRPMTLAQKAAIFEAEIDKRHRRTPFQFVHPVILESPGDRSKWRQTDSDNDGLWTAMYGAGECFAYAATKSDAARARAKQAFEALRFLGEVTQGGEHPAPKGFVARSILPTSGPDPNLNDSPENDRRMQSRDRRWKSMRPRWPKSADGKWYWKSDTSSDELDGHFFFYALYYDLVAAPGEERERVRAHVAAIADHLISHGFRFVDHDGLVTRWGAFNPEDLNAGTDFWQERGMNSLSILAYLKIAEHITGDAKYAAAARGLIDRFAYDANVLIAKTHLGAGAGNQSDDEMIFMNFYGLLRYEKDPALRAKYLRSFHNHWQNEQPERNPVFAFLYAAVASGEKITDTHSTIDLTPRGDWLADSIDTLRRLPLDRVDWPLTNSHRTDFVPLREAARRAGRASGHRIDGKVLPIDERYVGHWNHDPWTLDQGGAGRTLGDGAVFLLPYYMGLHHGFLRD